MTIAVNVFHARLEQSAVNRRWAERLVRAPGVTVRHLDALLEKRLAGLLKEMEEEHMAL